MSWVSDFLKGGKNPADAAMPYLDKIPGEAHTNYDPYINRGKQAGDIAQSQYDLMSQDPTAFINKLMEGYQTSEGYNFAKDEGTRALQNSAASGGMRGTYQDQENQGKLVNSLLSTDMQQWLNNLMGAQKTGLEGEQNLYNTGFNASSNLDTDINNAYGSQGSLAFQGQANKNKSQADLFKALLQGGTALATGGGFDNMNTLPSSGGMFF